MSFDPDKIAHRLIELGDDYADTEAAASLMEETRKTVLSQLKLKSAEGSDTARETEALASDEYRKHVENMILARRDANKAKVRLESMRAWIDLRRTQAANQRAEMRLT